MPWSEQSMQEARIAFVVRASHVRRGEFSEVCREFGISRVTGYKWVRRAMTSVSLLAGVEEKSRRPHRSPGRTEAGIEEVVVRWRQAEGWGAKKICQKLWERGMTVPVATIHRILRRHGLVAQERRQAAAVRRFERARPNELVQMDFKGEYRVAEGWCYPLTLEDDHSRFLLGLYALSDQRTDSVRRCVIRSFETYGVPEAMLLDHGIPWWSTTNGFGLTRLSVWLIKQGVTLIWSGIGHPQTQGKVERLHRTLAASLNHHGRPATMAGFETALARFRDVYNHDRPHEALAMDPPVRHYQPSRRTYHPQPREWQYPSGAIVQRLNSQGMLDWQGRRFVCEALAGEQVQIEPIEQRLLIKYRHLYIREIDLASGRTFPPVQPNSQNKV